MAGLSPTRRVRLHDFVEGQREQLLAAIGSTHLSGVRLVGDSFRPRSGQEISNGELRRIAHKTVVALGEHPTARALDDLGLLRLASGRYDAAVRTLERAVREAPADTLLHADLNAAYLARGRVHDNPRDLVRALEGIGPSPDLLESAFNRALTLQSLFLNRLAREAWAHYLERDRYSSWSQVAAHNMHALKAKDHAPVPGPHSYLSDDNSDQDLAKLAGPEEISAWIEEPGLATWISAVLGSNDARRRAIERLLRQAAERLERVSGDRLGVDEVNALVATPNDQRKALAGGLRDFADAKRSLDNYNFEKALTLFLRAAGRLRSSESPRLLWAEAGIAHCQFQLERYEIARRIAQRTLERARRGSYLAIEARCRWVLYSLSLARLDLDLARRNALDYLDLSQRASNPKAMATAHFMLGRVYDELGNAPLAWQHRMRALRSEAEHGSEQRLALMIGNTSFALAREREFHAAVDFASEELAFDRLERTPLGLTESLWMRAAHRVRAGEAEGALDDLHEAESYLSRIESTTTRVRLLGNVRAVQGEALLYRHPNIALARLDEALGYLKASGYEYGEVEILLDRARALGRLGRPQEALKDLNEAAYLIATQRGRIERTLLRVSFFDLQAELADERVATSLECNPRGETAFWIADQARGLLFQGDVSFGRSLPTSRFPEINEADALISYWSLPDSLLVWVVRHNRPPWLFRQPISRDSLVVQISDLATAIQSNGSSIVTSKLALRLGRQLLLPIKRELTGVNRLIVIPDRVVREVPWAALEVVPGEGPILRRFAIHICPAVAAVMADKKVRPPISGAERLLILGDPEVISDVAARQGPLPGSRREVEGIGRFFADHVELIGREATRARLSTELRRVSILHLASHSLVARDRQSWRIILAAKHDNVGPDLDTESVIHLLLSHLRLVVLSGCDTGREGEPSVEGTFADAGAFLAAGTAETVATLWPIDDDLTADLMLQFYRELLLGHTTDEALRLAQLAMLEKGGDVRRSPFSWAGFQVFSLGSHYGNRRSKG